MDRSQMEDALARALEIDAGVAEADATFGVETLQQLADELGVSQAAVARAIGEMTAPEPGPLNAIAHATVSASVSEVDRALASYLRLRGLHAVGSGVWQQQSGWWPDLYRFTAVTPVGVAIAPSDHGSVVRLTARLDRIWRVHVAVAVLAPVLIAVALLSTAGPAGLIGGLLWALAWVGFCAWAYQYRREAIRRRLAGALTDVAKPAYRLQPW